jgi:hypothetical protein
MRAKLHNVHIGFRTYGREQNGDGGGYLRRRLSRN